jgi:TRAP-type C4-dicarboxylate transport system permease small subunit
VILFSILASVVGIQVVFRYILNNPLSWPEELAGYVLVWFTLFGAVVATKRKAHTIVEFLLKRVSSEVHKTMLVLSFILISSLLWILIITGSIVTFKTNFPTVTLPFSWRTVYIALPISALLMFVRLVQISLTTHRSN